MNEQRSVNLLQNNCVIYLPVVVKGGARVVVFWGDVRRGLPANKTHPPNAATMYCQCRRRWTNIRLVYRANCVHHNHLELNSTSMYNQIIRGAFL